MVVAGKDVWDVVVSLSGLVRTGWMIRGVPPAVGETVATHSFSAALLALEISLKMSRKGMGVDVGRCVMMALVHDLAEAVVGDIPKTASISKAVKREAEFEAFKRLGLDPFFFELFEEFERGESVEARVARLAENLATYLRAEYYRRLGYRVDDIYVNMGRVVRELARDLGIEDIVGEYVSR